MPLTVGGGIKTLDDFRDILLAGADKIGVNSAAVSDSSIIGRAADKFGSQCVVVAIDAKKTCVSPSGYTVFINGGRKDTGIDAVLWAAEAERLGAGEILQTSMDADGTKNGFDLDLTKKITETVRIPVIASGGGGTLRHFYDVFTLAGADAALAATLFHYRELTVGEVKEYLNGRGIEVRH
jgi:cyclase